MVFCLYDIFINNALFIFYSCWTRLFGKGNIRDQWQKMGEIRLYQIIFQRFSTFIELLNFLFAWFCYQRRKGHGFLLAINILNFWYASCEVRCNRCSLKSGHYTIRNCGYIKVTAVSQSFQLMSYNVQAFSVWFPTRMDVYNVAYININLTNLERVEVAFL